jgi:flagellin-like hook-associated protein FlgL
MQVGFDTSNTIYNVETPKDTSRVSQLERENDRLEKQLDQLQNENQSLQSQLSSARTQAVKVEISQTKQENQTDRQALEQTKQFLETNNINIANESKNFDKQNVLSQAGSFVASQANAVPLNAQKLLA